MASLAVAERNVRVDPTRYPIRDSMGEGSLQRLISELFRPLLARALADMGIKAFVGADQFIYYERYNPTKAVAPDVYVMPGFPPDIEVGCWKVWETGVAPSFALEVVSRDHRKDFERSPARYAELGAKELVVFDPKFNEHSGGMRWLIYRILPKRGLVNAGATDSDRIYSKSLRLWLRAVGEGPHVRVRLARGPRGDELIPTADEIAAAAQAEIARLRAELSRLKRR